VILSCVANHGKLAVLYPHDTHTKFYTLGSNASQTGRNLLTSYKTWD